MAELTTYTLVEVAEILKVTRRTIYNYIKQGKMPATKVGHQWRVTGQALKEFLQVK